MTQINIIRNETGNITTDTKEMQRIRRGYYEELHAYKAYNPEDWGNFLETYKWPRQNYKEIKNLNRSITTEEIKTIIKNFI